MGESWEGTATSSGGSEDKELGTCKAHDVSSSAEEDRGLSKSAVGEDTGGAEKSGVGPVKSATNPRCDSGNQSYAEETLSRLQRIRHWDEIRIRLARK